MAFEVVRSNSAEVLFRALCLMLDERRDRCLIEPETVVVQGKGMERWLTMQFAQTNGVHANIRYPFPAHVGRRAVEIALALEKDATEKWSPGPLIWQVWEALESCIDEPLFAPIRGYLAADDSGRRRLQLVRQLARMFDDYNLYRPDWMVDWLAPKGGPEDDWQPVLWRALTERIETPSLGALEADFHERMLQEDIADPLVGLPDTLFFFGVAALPPIHLRLLRSVSKWRRLVWFLLEPTDAYYGDVRSKKEVAWLKSLVDLGPDIEQHHDVGHPLLGSLGRSRREFQASLSEVGIGLGAGQDAFAPPGEESLLSTLHTDIFSLRYRGGKDTPRYVLPPNSQPSVAFHACHSPMRQVEVLRDLLLGVFSDDASLEPRDVLILTPDVERYAPLVDAVFSAESEAQEHPSHPAVPSLPFKVADKSLRADNEVAQALLSLISLCESRFTAPDVLALLGHEPVRRKFKLDHEEMDTLSKWLSESGVRWGIDAEHRAHWDQPALPQNTWRWGLDRVLLGYVMPASEMDVSYDMLPYDVIEGEDAVRLDRFLKFWRAVLDLRDQMRGPRQMSDWATLLVRAVELLCAPTDKKSWQTLQVQQILRELEEHAEQAGCERELSVEALRSLLDGRFGESVPGGFLSGGITLCAMVPVRGVPFRVVCFLGMDDGAFPRIDRRPAFDKLSEARRLGDRSARDEDRGLFLDALLSAQERVMVFYTGRSIRTDEELSPAVPVVELLDYLMETTASKDADGLTETERRAQVREALVTQHPLQPFSPRCFAVDGEPSDLASFDVSLGAGASALQRAQAGAFEARAGFFGQGRLVISDEDRALDLSDLLSFYRNPVNHLLRNRMLINLHRTWREVEAREPVSLDYSDKDRLCEALLQGRLAGQTQDALRGWAKASGLLPLGQSGALALDEAVASTEELYELAKSVIPETASQALDLDIQVGAFRLHGRSTVYGPAGLVTFTAGKVFSGVRLALWIEHLAVQAELNRNGLELPAPSRLFELDAGEVVEWRYEPVANPLEQLATLLDLYWEGLQSPLMYFQQTSGVFAEDYFNPKTKPDKRDISKSRTKARKKWHYWDREGACFKGEGLKPENVLVFGPPGESARSPWDDGFSLDGDKPVSPTAVEVALALWLPLVSHESRSVR